MPAVCARFTATTSIERVLSDCLLLGNAKVVAANIMALSQKGVDGIVDAKFVKNVSSELESEPDQFASKGWPRIVYSSNRLLLFVANLVTEDARQISSAPHSSGDTFPNSSTPAIILESLKHWLQ